MFHITDDILFKNDIHKEIATADFSSLDALYEGRKIYYGDYHCHSNSGGNSDGHTTPEEWLEAMKQLKLDFVGLMDHRQVRHMYLDCFDEEFFLYGSEPAGSWNDPYLSFHYLMIVPERDCLIRALEKFPDMFEFTGGPEGTFKYKRVDKEVFMELADTIRQEGGVVVHAHPKQVMKSNRASDFYFGPNTVIETIYACSYPEILNEHTVDNYKLWMDMLNEGYKVINTATSDCHEIPTNIAMNALYSAEKNGKAYVELLRRGDLNAGFIGIKMSIDDCPVGSTTSYAPGKQLLIKVEDIHPTHLKENESYRLEVITDRGIAYSGTMKIPFKLALEVEDRKFYRVMIIRESDGAPAAIGNPIWLEK